MKRLFPVPLPIVLVVLLGACSADPGRWLHAPNHQSKPPEGQAASAAADGLPHVALASRTFVLDNGLTLIVHPDHRAPLVAVDVWYHVGAKDEPPGRHGFAHLFEHLMFNGSEHRPGAYFRPLEAAGATDINGSTDHDRTDFHETVPKSALDLALWMESERMRDLPGGIDQAQLDAQRQVVINEKRQRENRPYGDVPGRIARATYPPDHPYSWTPIGAVKDLRAATPDDVRQWFSRYYAPANATLVVAGDVDPQAIKARVERYFGALPAGRRVGHVDRWVARMQGERRRTVVEDVPQARLYMVWNVPPAFDADTARLQLAAAVLADGRDSRLDKRLVGASLATDVTARVVPREIGSQFVVTVDARAGVSLDRIEQVIDETLGRLLADGPTGAELARVRTALLAHLVRALQPLAAQADWLARSQVYGGAADAWKGPLAVLRGADPDQVRDAARNWLADGVFILRVIPARPRTAGAADVDRSQPPATGAPAALKLPLLQSATLPNGMQILLAQRRAAPLVDFDLLMGGGRASDAGLPDGTAALTFDLLSAGTARDSAADITRKLQALGATFHAGVGADTGDIHLSALVARLAPSLELYADIVRHPAFPPAEIARYRQRLLAAIDQQRATPMGVLARVITPLLFGPGHPYAHVGLGVPDEIRSLQRADLVAYAKRWLRPDNATLLVTGDIDMAHLRPLVEARFGDWRASPIPLTRLQIPSVPLPAGSRVFLVDKPGAAQSVVVAANVAPPPAEADAPAFGIIDAALGGNFVSRLNMDLREMRHWSYGAFSGLIPAEHQQIFYAGAAVQTDRTADAMRVIDQQLQAVVGPMPLTGEEIATARQSEIRSLPATVQTLDGLAARYKRILELGLPENSDDTLVQRLQALTPDQIRAATARLIHPDALTWIVVGDRVKIAPAIQALGLGPLQIIDADDVPQ